MKRDTTAERVASTDRMPAVYLPATPSLRSNRLSRFVRRITRRRGPIGWDRRTERN